MSVERAELQIATVAGKYPGESGSNTLTLSMGTNTNKKLLDYDYTLEESVPRTFKAILSNGDGGLTGASYDATAGEGDIVSGLEILLYDYPTATDAKTLALHGVIDKVNQVDGRLHIEGRSNLAVLEDMRRDTYWADTYREEDGAIITQPTAEDWPASIQITDSTPVMPLTWISVCIDKGLKDYSNDNDSSSTYENITAATTLIAQPFPGKDASHIGFIQVKFKAGGSNTADLRFSIQKMSSGEPDGTKICYEDKTSISTSDENLLGSSLVAWDDPLEYDNRLDEEADYALVIEVIGDDSTVDLYIKKTSGSSIFKPAAQKYTPSAWAEQDWNLAPFYMWLTPWIEQDAGKTWQRTPSQLVTLEGSGNPAAFHATFDRAVVTYFYDSLTYANIMRYLIDLSGFTDNVDTGITDTTGIFQTNGKTMLECLRQLADLEDGGLGRQSVVYDTWSAGTTTIYVRGKYETSDASVRTFADNGSTDEQLRIVGKDLDKSDALKINTVYVIGEQSADRKIFAQAVDWTARAKFREVAHWVVDKNITEYYAARKEAHRLLNLVNRTDWSGSITVNGCHFDLMDFSTGVSGTTKGGKIITLDIDELNISSTKFKVRGVKCIPGKSIIFVTSYDYSRDDEIDMVRQRRRMADNFVTSADIINDYYFSKRYDGTVTDYYMELQDSGGSAIAGQTRIQCVYTTINSIKTLHAVFPPGNGYTVSGTRIAKIGFYAAVSGGSAVDTVTLDSCEQFYKLKTSRVTVDIFANG